MTGRWLQLDIRADEEVVTVAVIAPGQRLRAHSHAIRHSRAELVALSSTLRRTICRGRSLDVAHALELQALHKEIFRRDVGRIFSEALSADAPLQLRLNIEDPALACFPWGALRPPGVGTKPLALEPRIWLSRAIEDTRPIIPMVKDGPLRLLILAPGGAETARTLWRELRAQTDAAIDVEFLAGPTATWSALKNRLEIGALHALHFIGLGDRDTLQLASGPLAIAALVDVLPRSLRVCYLQASREASPGLLLPIAATLASACGAAVSDLWGLPGQYGQAIARRFYTTLAQRGDISTSLWTVRSAFQAGVRFAPLLFLRGERSLLFGSPGDVPVASGEALERESGEPATTEVPPSAGLKSGWSGHLDRSWGKLRWDETGGLQNFTDTFGDPQQLARYYVEPDRWKPQSQEAPLREPVHELLDAVLRQPPSSTPGANVLFVLGEAGAGKTSLMTMLKLAHLAGRWAKGLRLVLARLGEAPPDRDEAHRTVLLLDGLDTDPAATSDLESRVLSLLETTQDFHLVLITCRTRFLLGEPLEELRPERQEFLEIDGWRCPLLHLAPFSAEQAEWYLQRRFPNSWTDRLRKIFTRTDNDSLTRARGVTQRLRGVGGKPLWLAHIGPLVEKTPRSAEPWALYHALTDVWIQRVCEQHEEVDPESMLDLCTALALHLHTNELEQLEQSASAQLGYRATRLRWLRELSPDPEGLILATSDGALRFSHVGLRSFLVVRWALENNSDQIAPLTDLMRDLMWSSVRLTGTEGLQKLRAAQLAHTLTSELRGAQLQRAALRGFDMRGADLRGADLQHADLRGAGLQGAILQRTDLRSALLQGTNFAGADLEGAELRAQDLEGALYDEETLWPDGFHLPATLIQIGPGQDLQRQVLQGVNLRGANLQKANLRVAKFQDAELQGVNLRGSNLQRANFQNANLEGANLENSDLQRSDLQHANLKGADLLGADLRYAFLRGAQFIEADLQGAQMSHAKLQSAALTGAQLQWADLRKVRLEGANLEGANLEGANLEGARYDAETLWPEGFDPDQARAVPT